MAHTNQTRPAGGAAGLDKSSSLLGDNREIVRNPAPTQVEFRNPRAVKEAKLELLRESIFENLGAAGLFITTAQLLIEAIDDAGMAHAVKMGAHHYRAAVLTAKELAALKPSGIDGAP